MQAISRGVGDCTTKVGSLHGRFVDIEALVKTQIENGISKIFNLRCQTIDVSDQAIFTLKDLGFHDKQGKKTSASDALTVS